MYLDVVCLDVNIFIANVLDSTYTYTLHKIRRTVFTLLYQPHFLSCLSLVVSPSSSSQSPLPLSPSEILATIITLPTTQQTPSTGRIARRTAMITWGVLNSV